MCRIAALSICVAATFTRTGKSRWGLAAGTAALGSFALTALVPLGQTNATDSSALQLFIYGFLAF